MTFKFRPSLLIFITAQVVLLIIELVTHYDTAVRQNALALTNVGSLIGVIWFDRWLSRRGGQLSLATMMIVAAAVWLDAMGNFQHLYANFWWWDRVAHSVGGMAVCALFIDLFLTQQLRGIWTTSRLPAIWFGFLIGQMAAAFYEITEWLGDLWFKTERVRGPYDTPHDLFFNLFGGLLVVVVILMQKKSRGNDVRD